MVGGGAPRLHLSVIEQTYTVPANVRPARADKILAKAFPDGRIGSVLAKLIELQAKAVKLIG